MVVGGRLLRFTGECAGDVGHVIVEPGGLECTCGSRGCLEAMICSRALSSRASSRKPRDVIDAARNGDAEAMEALAETGRFLGIGLASLSPIFAPEKIAIGGGIASAAE